MFSSWLLKDRWIGLLDSDLKILCTFQPWQFLPSCPKALLWFQGTCRTWSLMSSELHDLSELHVSQLETCLSSTSPRSCASQSSEGSCPTNTELLLEKLSFGKIEKCWLYILKLWWLFSAVEWGLAEMLHFVCGERQHGDAAMHTVCGL